MMAEDLRKIRTKLNLSQADMAKLVHKSLRQYVRYENEGPIDEAVADLAKRLLKDRRTKKA